MSSVNFKYPLADSFILFYCTGGVNMSRKCDLTGKKSMMGHRISHAHNVSKVRLLPNVQKKRIYIPSLKKFIRMKVSTSALKTLDKLGIEEFLKKIS